MTDGTYRSEVECLRAELDVRTAQLERAREENQRLTALLNPPKPATRWGVHEASQDGAGAWIVPFFMLGIVCFIGWAVLFVGWGHVPFSTPIEQRGGIVAVLYLALWCLAFIRKVPK